MFITIKRTAARTVGVTMAGAALVAVGLMASAPRGETGMGAAPLHAPLAPTTSTAPSVAPSHPVDCNDPNNSVNCQTPPIDSPLVVGTASPGSPFRD